ncbi:uncharacterized protein LOC105421063 [Amborella trichopoda]|uniref:uncharacterized protein LOC105421063 n=1 Tax=Amborella trichopoda TaxID=13333 RepID=UPI0009BD23A2|nr:uncharacterized protein LOC105421063 [Amborella trichopoda]|eukprot:XP_020526103.1 uncharacterized protein LOC105421063 [Amborella trichopoda]
MVVEKVVLLCHFGGQFIGNTNGGNASYEGGDTRAVMVPRDISFNELQSKLATISSLRAGSFSIKYQAIGTSCLVSIYDDNDVVTMLSLSVEQKPMYVIVCFVEQSVGYEDGGGTGDIHKDPPVLRILKQLREYHKECLVLVKDQQKDCRVLGNTFRILKSRKSETRIICETLQIVSQGVSRTRKRSTRGVSSAGDLETPQIVTQGVSSGGDFETPLTVLPTLVIGAEFQDAHSFRKTLVSFAISENFALKFIKNDASRVTAKCQAKGCTFHIHASRVSGLKLFRIRTMNPLNTCDRLLNGSHPQVQSEWIADKIKQHL